MKNTFRDAGFFRAIWDAVPAPLFVVDDDVRIMDLNLAAGRMLGCKEEFVLRRRCGEVVHCIHIEDDPAGCGRGELCGNCTVRNAVGSAFRGEEITRERARMELKPGAAAQPVDFLVTTAPIRLEDARYALLVLEDISELMALRELLPICAGCKKTRDDQAYRRKLDAYLGSHLEIELTHSLCRDCLKKLSPDVKIK